MNNRRNFYRILRVQPDASQKVIQQSYRSLMQTLKLHPDLGGTHWGAGVVNQAYNTLRDFRKRAEYDTELFRRYNIQTLSKGGVITCSSDGLDQFDMTQYDSNRRNYYRVLHIQPDAEMEVVKVSYHALSDQLVGGCKKLLDEAIQIVGDERLRVQYDALLKSYSHVISIKKLKNVAFPNKSLRNQASAILLTEGYSDDEVVSAENLVLAYQLKANYCRFCNTPFVDSHLVGAAHFCKKCASPLSLPIDMFADNPRRSLVRIPQTEPANIYEFWPSEPRLVSLEDLSPAGLKFLAPRSFDVGQIIKVDAHHFQAVAKVAHSQNINSISISTGARFLTVEFMRTTGSFLSEVA